MQVTKSKELSLREKLLPETSYYISNASDIAELRKAIGATQEEFARIIGVVASTVHRWEKGIGKPESKRARKLGRLKEIVDLLQAGFQVEELNFSTCAIGDGERIKDGFRHPPQVSSGFGGEFRGSLSLLDPPTVSKLAPGLIRGLPLKGTQQV